MPSLPLASSQISEFLLEFQIPRQSLAFVVSDSVLLVGQTIRQRHDFLQPRLSSNALGVEAGVVRLSEGKPHDFLEIPPKRPSLSRLTSLGYPRNGIGWVGDKIQSTRHTAILSDASPPRHAPY